MKNLIIALLFVSSSNFVYSQSNSFPLLSQGDYSGGSGDHTNIINPQLKLQSYTGYIRIPHVSANSGVSVVYNFQTGKNVYWGEPSDQGKYIFRGRNIIVENSRLGIGIHDPSTLLSLGTPVQKRMISLHDNPSDWYGLGIQPSQMRFQVGHPGAKFSFFAGDNSEVFNINGNGNVGIGTTAPDAKLTVAGKIHAQEIKVTTNAGADFVFNEEYNLRSLQETEKFILDNKHLPDIPSANEMVENGITLGEMNIKLLQKIEELTLYQIQFLKEIQQLKQDYLAVSEKNEMLIKEVRALKHQYDEQQ